jgi:hypothetical protein
VVLWEVPTFKTTQCHKPEDRKRRSHARSLYCCSACRPIIEDIKLVSIISYSIDSNFSEGAKVQARGSG